MFKKVLTKSGLVVYDTENLIIVRYNKKETNEVILKDHLEIDYNILDDFCEVVHLELTDRCNLKCKYCYKEKSKKMELKTEDWYKIIDSLVEYGIFQVTFGGGEPLMRKDMPDLLDYCVNKNLNVAMTTNGILLASFSKSTMTKFKQINVSYHGDMLILVNALKYLEDIKVKSGINFVLRREYVKHIEAIMALSKTFDAEVLFLTYKPVIKDYDNVVDGNIVYSIAKYYANKNYKVAVDGMTCFGKTDEYCLQKRRFADIYSNGDVYPCSFVRKSMGNILQKSFSEIWKMRGEQIKCPFIK